MPPIITCLWFDDQAEAAAKFYATVFDNAPGATVKSKVMGKEYYPEATEEVSGKPKGSVMTVSFEVGGREFLGLNGGKEFRFNEAISFIITCSDQAEVDYFWDCLIADGGAESQCGWLKDKYGVSWQVVPEQFSQIMMKNPEQVTKAMLQMKKLVIADLERAAA